MRRAFLNPRRGWLGVTTDQAKKRKLCSQGSKKATMSWMKGDLLSKTRRLVGGLATREPVWLKAMEA